MPPIDYEDGEDDGDFGLPSEGGEGMDVGGGADVPVIQQPPSLPPDIDPAVALRSSSRMSGSSALRERAAGNRDRITKLLDKHFQRREAPTAEFADIGAAAGLALKGTPYSAAKMQVEQSNQRGDIALGNAQSSLDQRAITTDQNERKMDAAGISQQLRLGQMIQRQTDAAARTGDRRANMLRRTVMDLAKTTDDPLTASSLAFAAIGEADKHGLILPESWQADVARIGVDAITKAGIKSKPKADKSTEFDRLIGELTNPEDIAAAKRIRLRLQAGAQGPVAMTDAQGNPIVVDKATSTSTYVTPRQQGQVATPPVPGQPASPPGSANPTTAGAPLPKKTMEDSQKDMKNLHATVLEFDRVSRELETAGPNAVGLAGAGADFFGGLYNQVAPFIGMEPSRQVSNIKAFRSSIQPLVGNIARVLNGPGSLSNEDRRRADQATRILESSSDFGSVGLALQTLQEVFRKKYESAKALSGPGGQAIEGALGAPPATAPAADMWNDGEFEYRRAANGRVQRRRMQ